MPVETVTRTLKSLVSEDKIFGILSETNEEFIFLSPEEVSKLIAFLRSNSCLVEKFAARLDLETPVMRQMIDELLRRNKIEGTFTENGKFIPTSVIRNSVMKMSEKAGKIGISEMSSELGVPENEIASIMKGLGNEVVWAISGLERIELTNLSRATKMSESFLTALFNWLVLEGAISSPAEGFTSAQIAKGLVKWQDKNGEDKWGTPEQAKSWKKIEIGIQSNFQDYTDREFEEFIAGLFRKMDYQAELTSYVKDWGADIVLRKGEDTIAVQVKKWRVGHNVGVQDVNQVIASMRRYKANKAILVTTSDFTERAKMLQETDPVELWNRRVLNEMIERYLFG